MNEIPERAWELLTQLVLTASQRFKDLQPYAQYRWNSERFWSDPMLITFLRLKLEVTESPNVGPWNRRLQ